LHVLRRPGRQRRADFTGTLDEVRRDFETSREPGVDDLIVVPDASSGNNADQFLRNQEVLRALA
jgi:hypothetical protein